MKQEIIIVLLNIAYLLHNFNWYFIIKKYIYIILLSLLLGFRKSHDAF